MKLAVRTIAVIFIACISCLVATASAQDKGKTYVGRGATPYGAKQDAIRTALQEQVPQLVVADRAVSDAEIIIDDVISTMNGYIDEFELLTLTKEANGEFVVRAKINIAEQMIKNRVALLKGASGQINGNQLFDFALKREAQQSAAHLNAIANGDIIRRLFRGFPSEAFNVDITGIEPAPAGREQDLTYLALKIVPDESFIEQIRSTLRVNSYGKCANYSCREYIPGRRCTGSMCEQVAEDYANAFPERYSPPGMRFCFKYNGNVECYALKPWKNAGGDEKVDNVVKPKIAIAVDVFDESNQSVLLGNKCLIKWPRELDGRYQPKTGSIRSRTGPVSFMWLFDTKAVLSEPWGDFFLDFGPFKASITLDTDEFDVERASEIRASTIYHIKRERYSTNNTDPAGLVASMVYAGQSKDYCENLRWR